MINDGFFKAFNRSGNLVELPPGSFKIPNLTEVPNDFFASFNEGGSLKSLPETSFDTSQIIKVGQGFFQ
jgi:hypothetical protein